MRRHKYFFNTTLPWYLCGKHPLDAKGVPSRGGGEYCEASGSA
jgi:hypothetical protein